SPARADEYVAQTARVGRALGAVDVPETVAGLTAAIEGYRPALRATPAALDAAQFLLREPPVPRTLRPGYTALAAAAVESLPPWATDALGLPQRGRVATAAARAAGHGATRTI